MTASEHMSASREHSEQITGMHAHSVYGAGYPGWYSGGWYPWYYSWDPDVEHRGLAAAHREAAEQLNVEYTAACKQVPREVAASSLLDSFATATSRTENGVLFYLAAEAGPPEVVLAQLRCHRAWLRLAPTAEAVDSPLLVEGVTWMTHVGANGIEVMASARDERSIAELARRAGLLIERNHKRSAMR